MLHSNTPTVPISLASFPVALVVQVRRYENVDDAKRPIGGFSSRFAANRLLIGASLNVLLYADILAFVAGLGWTLGTWSQQLLVLAVLSARQPVPQF